MNKPKSIKDQVAKLPRVPGVYFFKDKAGEILYVGKATSLRDRVRSYWSGTGEHAGSPLLLRRGPAIEKMVGLISKIEYEQYDSSMEALIAEANYIKRYLPKYNIQFKDDKSYYYVKIEDSDLSGYPRLGLVHKNQIMFDEKGVRYFGPYTTSKNLRNALKVIRRIFGYRSCNLMPKKACLQHDIKRCPGPCIGGVEKNEYRRNIRHIVMMLEGKKDRLLFQLKRDMERLSKKQDFEEAARIRDQYLALQHLKTSARISDFDLEVKPNEIAKENVPFRIEGYDVSNTSGKEAAVSMVVFLNGKPFKRFYKKFKIKNTTGPNDYAMLQEAIRRRLGHVVISDDGAQEIIDDRTWDFIENESWNLPDLMVIDGGRGQLSAVEVALNEAGVDIPLVGIAKGPKRIKEDLYFSNKANFKDVSIIRAVRDEAHRFALAYHKLLRDKQLIKSELKNIPGVGSEKARILLKTFGSVKNISQTSVSDLERTVGKNTARIIVQYLKTDR